ncbi:LytR/AlgR family response regulator transcription factor [Allomuricauda sp. ARW1Y1]|jgi:hypothetical protein|uniref:LytR/AlgR family response regulator transcription factor n=1 Tax=Allomuricauda sp. ARW1Y1 TaxID=2663843 RepID=UPI0015C8F7BA|nr:LytTR family DNA-binding domain-containing protein [Muricauda sp. ARW1Y1]NYJ27876.1 hypothetical protein [Muricauda sp. ARW1Y1]
MILEFLKKPYPFIFNRYSVWVPSSITFVLIIFLAPLGFSSIDLFERVVIALVIALIIAGTIHFGVIGLKRLLPSYMGEDSWTIGKEFVLYVFILSVIILTISCVFIAVVLYQYDSINPAEIFLNVFLRTAKITFGICIIPIVISILIEQKNYQKRQFLKAHQLSENLKKEIFSIKNEKSKREEKVLFRSDNNDIELQLNFEDIIFIKSDGNYIEVHYQNKHNIAKKVIRQRIKNIEASLPKDIFFRCHNRFIVNKSFIININGNARGLSLELANSDETINVSRTKIKALESFLVQ